MKAAPKSIIRAFCSSVRPSGRSRPSPTNELLLGPETCLVAGTSTARASRPAGHCDSSRFTFPVTRQTGRPAYSLDKHLPLSDVHACSGSHATAPNQEKACICRSRSSAPSCTTATLSRSRKSPAQALMSIATVACICTSMVGQVGAPATLDLLDLGTFPVTLLRLDQLEGHPDFYLRQRIRLAYRTGASV